MTTKNLPAQISSSDVPEQLSLELFRGLMAENTRIDEAPLEIGFRKSDALFDVGEMGIAARRLLDAAYWFASKEIDKCSAEGVKGVPETYDIGIEDFKWLMNYDSNNHAHLKKCIREAQKSAIEVNPSENSGQYASVPLLGPAGINNGRFVFQLARPIQRLLANPENRTFLSIRITAAFTSAYAHALYGLLLRSRNERGETEWIPLADLRAAMGATAKSNNVFKDFRRYALEPAIDQINKFSDLFVVLETKAGGGGRAITHLRFLCRSNAAGFRRLLAESAVSRKDLYDVLAHEFGLSQAELDEIVRMGDEWSEDRINQAIALTRVRAKGGRVKYPGAFLMKAIRDGLRLGTLELETRPVAGSGAHRPIPTEPQVPVRAPEAEPEPRRRKAPAEAPKARAVEGAAKRVDSDIEGALAWYGKQRKARKEEIFDAYIAQRRSRSKLVELDTVLASALERGRFAAYLLTVRDAA
jgi:hypothetical protein